MQKKLLKGERIDLEGQSHDFKEQIGDRTLNISWRKDENKKDISVNRETIINIWNKNVLCYMGPNRYEKPAWMGDNIGQMSYFIQL